MTDNTLSLRYLFGKGSVLLVLKLFSAFIGFCFHVYIARKLSLTEFGLLNLALTCILFIVAIAKQGLEPAIVKGFAQVGLRQIAPLYQHIIVYTLINLVMVCVIFWGFANVIFTSLLATPQLIDMLPLIIVLTAFQTWLGVNSSVLKGQQYPLLSLLFTGIVTYCIALGICLHIESLSAFTVLTILAYSTLIAVIISFILIKIKLRVGTAFFKFSSLESSGFVNVLSVSRVLFVSSIASLIAQQLGVLVLAKYASLDDVGLYSVALKISLLLSYPLVVINMITAPRYAKLYGDNQLKEFKVLAKLTTKLLILLASLMLLFVAFFAENLVVLFGEKYYEAAPFLIVLAVGQWFNLSTGSVVSMLVMTGHEIIHRRNMIFIALFTSVALFLFVPIYGVIASAWVTSISMISLNLVSLYFVNKHIYKLR
ncbi:oligosaccharide flippase family protein [Thalassotalea castellviae]|uniref:Oligosaccharide flippase family protein n=1 Tax=Thalassotalea castellviae TaxID=3075612 RepID=A0ABU2ZYM7_9GAMM|nr:oligosaccharide flippase family protein [Thalassotalea sp. W431]MDT0602805.1 oligosaccharide flippase family protein [Thalassotalea sp. W431]